MPTLISPPITVWREEAKARKIAAANNESVEADDTAKFIVTPRKDGGFVIEIHEDGEFVMCL